MGVFIKLDILNEKEKMTKEQTPEEVWEEVQLIAAQSYKELMEAVKVFDENKFKMSEEDRQTVENQIFRRRVEIQNYLMTSRDAYVAYLESDNA